MSQPIIRFQNVSKRFWLTPDRPQTVLEMFISAIKFNSRPQSQELWAVRDLSFDIFRGDSLGIIGRNGAGKSTLLKLVTRILRPTSGRVLVQGRISALLELGAGFHPDLSGRENIYLNGSVLGLSKQDIDRYYQSIVDFSELHDFIDMPVKHYSSGMYMRLGFSVAIHVQPDVLVVDEILAVGDQAFQTKCLERIWEMRRQGVTIVLVSHQLHLIREVCSQLIWVEHGQVKAVGPAEEVMEKYLAFYASLAAPAGNSPHTFPRWGSGEIEITNVRFLDVDGQLRADFMTGEALTIVIDYQAHQPLHQPHFDVTLFREDGVLLNTPTPRPIGGLVSGSGSVVCRIEYLPLLPAGYKVSAAIHDGNQSHAYDHHEKAYSFKVIARPEQNGHGLVEIPVTWDWLTQPEMEKNLSPQ